MKQQASLSLLKVNNPISTVAPSGSLLLRATDNGLKLYNDLGEEVPIVETSDSQHIFNVSEFPTSGMINNSLYITNAGQQKAYFNGRYYDVYNNDNYTAFNVYAHDYVIPAGTHDSVRDEDYVVEVPAGMTHAFVIRSRSNKDLQDVIVEWGDGSFTSLKNDDVQWVNAGDRRYTVSHTYTSNGIYTVKVWGTTFFGIWHSSDDYTGVNNLLCEAMTSYLPIANCHTNLGGFLQGAQHLTWLSVGLYHFYNKTNLGYLCFKCKNLVEAYGFSAIDKINDLHQIFDGCDNLERTDFCFPSLVDVKDGFNTAFRGCSKLARPLSAFFPPTQFSFNGVEFKNIFEGCSSLTWSDGVDKILWNNPTINWFSTVDAFTGCSDDVRSHVPTSWGGTSTEEPIGNIPHNKISLNGKNPNTANGLVILNENGKVDNSLINLSNYSQADNIMITSTNGVSQLISNAGESALYSNSSYVKANGSDIELGGTHFRFNNHNENTSGGLVIVGDDGKIPTTLYNQGTTDLSNYRGRVTINSSEYITINSTNPISIGDNSNLYLSTLVAKLSSPSNVSLEGTDLQWNGKGLNTSNGLVKLDTNGKIPSSILPELSTDVNLTNYVNTDKISLTSSKESSVTLKADAMEEGYENIITIGSGVCPDGNTGAYINLSSGGHCFIENGYGFYIGFQSAFYTISLNSNELLFNGHNYNTSNGIVVLGDDGKIPSSLYDAGSQSIFQVDSFPSSGTNNSLYVDKTTSEVKGYFDGAWQNISFECVDVISGSASTETVPSTKAVKDYVDALPHGPEMKTAAVTKDIVFKKDISVYKIELSVATTFTFDFSELSEDACYTFELWVQMNTPATLTFPSNVQWLDNIAPDMSESSMYCIVIRKMPNTMVTSTITSPTAIMNLAYKYAFTMGA